MELEEVPRFKEDRTFIPETTLQQLFSNDLGSVKVLPPHGNNIIIMGLPRGKPDLVYLKAGGDPNAPESVLFCVEIKRPSLRIYQMLQDLQGQYLPKLKIAGIADGIEMVLVTDFMGTDINQELLNASDHEKFQVALRAIYDFGVVRGDIQPHNILV
ncbi:MAG: hypothetical protein J3R72DRAFT_518899 [Linnemannia gamsii]|nr:MAG: hypothetical protein J3R72DRAFT_518899 [Linnemannia gamsii]